MTARSLSSNQRSDTLMQDRSSPSRQNLLATHGRTIHVGHQRRSALITVADKFLLYSESNRIAAWTRNDAKCHYRHYDESRRSLVAWLGRPNNFPLKSGPDIVAVNYSTP